MKRMAAVEKFVYRINAWRNRGYKSGGGMQPETFVVTDTETSNDGLANILQARMAFLQGVEVLQSSSLGKAIELVEVNDGHEA